MPRIKIDGNAHDILKRYKEELEDRKIEGADFSDALREMDRKIKEKGWNDTIVEKSDLS